MCMLYFNTKFVDAFWEIYKNQYYNIFYIKEVGPNFLKIT